MQKHQAFWMVSWALLAAHASAILECSPIGLRTVGT